jgi:hypothetical protein
MNCLNETLKRSLLIILVFLEIVISGFSQDVPILRPIDAPPLEYDSESSNNDLFPINVGGVAFKETARLNPALQINNLTIRYDTGQPDGNRLQLTINGEKSHYTLYDWQLIPLVKYADSRYVACFSYFGELLNKELENIVLKNDGHIMNYHQELYNTLLGYRIAYMDLMVMYEFTTGLPKQNGAWLLGASESNPDVVANTLGQVQFIQHLNKIENDLGYTFRSYIITDHSREIQISLKNDTLNLSGFPYYRCWYYREDTKGFNKKSINDSITNRYQVILNNELAKNPNFYTRGLYIDSLITLSVKYPKGYQATTYIDFIELVALKTVAEKKAFLERYYTESLKEMLFLTASEMEYKRVIYLTEFSNRMSQYPEMLKATNPATWNATVLTMRTAAFFRYVKANFPTEWQALVAQVKGKTPEPAVRTPTVIYNSPNSIIEEAISTGIPAVPEKPEDILIYPNPVKDMLYIDQISRNSVISVISPEGKVVVQENAVGEQHRISLKGLPDGIYLIRIADGQKRVFTRSIIKSR